MRDGHFRTFKKHNSIKDKLLRFLSGILWQVPWLSCLYGIGYYIQKKLPDYLNIYFDLSTAQRISRALQIRVNVLQDTLSLSNPFNIGEYVSALTASSFAKAKESTLEKTIEFLIGFYEGIFHFIFICAVIYAFFRILRYYHERSLENNIANKVVQKLIPILKEIHHQKENQS